jgi:hypothetical protein
MGVMENSEIPNTLGVILGNISGENDTFSSSGVLFWGFDEKNEWGWASQIILENRNIIRSS